jgi:hypothetical protein
VGLLALEATASAIASRVEFDRQRPTPQVPRQTQFSRETLARIRREVDDAVRASLARARSSRLQQCGGQEQPGSDAPAGHPQEPGIDLPHDLLREPTHGTSSDEASVPSVEGATWRRGIDVAKRRCGARFAVSHHYGPMLSDTASSARLIVITLLDRATKIYEASLQLCRRGYGEQALMLGRLTDPPLCQHRSRYRPSYRLQVQCVRNVHRRGQLGRRGRPGTHRRCPPVGWGPVAGSNPVAPTDWMPLGSGIRRGRHAREGDTSQLGSATPTVGLAFTPCRRGCFPPDFVDAFGASALLAL